MEIQYLHDLNFSKRKKHLDDKKPNFWMFFIVSLVNHIAVEKDYYEYFKNLQNAPIEDKNEVIKQVFKLFEEFRTNQTGGITIDNLIQNFYNKEKEVTKHGTSKKTKSYHQFLKEAEARMELFLFMGFSRRYENRSIEFEAYAQPKLGDDFVNLLGLKFNLENVFYSLDKLYFKELLYDQKIPKKKAKQELSKKFDFANNRSPIIFIEYPRELAIYKRLLKNWLLMEIEKRKRQFMPYLKEFPAIYDPIIDYANGLLDPKEINYLTVNTPEYYQYPQHIFKGFKGFKLFEYYAETLVSETQFTFLYRYMRDEEREDFKIVADPGTFREWFDNQEYTDQTYAINGTLSKVRTKEREQNFKLVKTLIDQMYVVT